MTFQQFKFRVHFACQVFLGRCVPAQVLPLIDHEREALKRALSALANIGSNQKRGCERKPWAASEYKAITEQLNDAGVVL